MSIIILIIGALGSLFTLDYLPITGAIVLTLIYQESIIYDLHRHINKLEDINGKSRYL